MNYDKLQSSIRKLSCYNLPWPTDWAQVFGADRPLILEIGFGNGDHLIHLGRTKPDHHIIGVEVANQSLEKAERKIHHQRLSNARAVHGRGETALHHLFGPASLSEVHINYPDPWFKDRHAGRRLVQRDTLDAIVSRLLPGGRLYLATDIVAYAEMSHALLIETPGLTNCLAEAWVHELPGRFMTKYELKGLREGRSGHYFVYERNDQPAPKIPVVRDLPMPHVVLQTPMPLSDVLAQSGQLAYDAGDIHVSVIDTYINARRGALLFEVYIDEPTIEMHIGIMVTPRDEPNTYTVRYNTMGFPRSTLGLRQATAFLADWIVSLHPEAKIIESRVSTE